MILVMFTLKIKTNNSVHMPYRSKPSLNFFVQMSGSSSSSVTESCSDKLTTFSGSETSSAESLVITEERTRKLMF